MENKESVSSLATLIESIPKKAFEEIAFLAAVVCRSSFSAVTITDRKQSAFFKWVYGITSPTAHFEQFIGRICDLLPDGVMEISELQSNEALKEEPFVIQNPHLSYFVCIPITINSEGAIGVISVFDALNEPLEDTQKEALALLAGRVKEIVDFQQSSMGVEKLYQQLEEASRIGKIGYWELNLESGELYWSKEVYKIWEKHPEFFTPTYEDFLASVHEEDLEFFNKAQDDAVEGRSELNFRHRIFLDDGSIKWVHERGRLVLDSDKKAIALIGSVQDITDQKLHELSIAQHADFIGTTLDNLPIGIAVNRISTGQATYMNQRFSEIYGWPEEELKDVDTFFQLIYPDPRVRKKMKKSILDDLESGDPGRMEWKGIHITTSGGIHRIINGKNIPLTQQDLMISTVTDVTNSYTIRRELSAMNERFSLVSKATSDTIWDRNLLEKELFWGENSTPNLGYQDKGDAKKNYTQWFNNIHPEDSKRVVKSYQKALKGTEDHWACEYRFQHFEDGARYLTVNDRGFILRDEGGMAIRMVGAMQDVTEKYEREQKLKLFESVVSSSNDAIIVTEAEPLSAPEGPKITYVNKAFETMTGYSAREVIGKTPRFLQGPATKTETIAEMGRLLRAFKLVDVDIINYKKDGEAFWVNLSIAPVRGPKGDFSHFISIQREINLARAEKENRDLISELAQVISASQDFGSLLNEITRTICGKIDVQAAELWLINDGGSTIELLAFTSKQKKQEKLKGAEEKLSFYKGQGLPGKIWQKKQAVNIRNLQDEDSEFQRKEVAAEVGIHGAYGVPLLLEDQIQGCLIVYTSGRARSLEALIDQRLHGLDYFLGAEIQRKKVQYQLESILQSVPDIICKVGPEGHFKRINNSSSKILGYDPEEMIGRHFTEFLHVEDVPESNKRFEEISSGSPIDYFENRYICKNGDVIWMAWTASPADMEGNHLSVGKDITERKKFEKELLRLNKDLKEKNEKLARSNTELEHFAHVASHDLQEPLRMISGFLTQLNKKYGQVLDDKGKTYIHYAVDGASRMRTIIQELLQYSRLGRQYEETETVAVSEVIEGVEALYRQLLKETGAEIIKPKNLPVVRAPRVLLFQVFQNLLDNALKYRRDGVAPRIQIQTEETEKHWLFKIQDNGIGIDEQYYEKIFVIFQRLHTKSEYEGTGMGLTNTRKIIESLGGQIQVSSIPGEGSEFTFSIKKSKENS